MVVVQAERGLYKLKYKRSHYDDEFHTLDFLQSKIIKLQEFPDVPAVLVPRGISAERKKAIIAKLLPLMPENRKSFWYNLLVSEATDLTQSE